MSFTEYINKEILLIEWTSRHLHISINAAAQLWVQTGMAELYAKKYRSEQTRTR